MTVQELGSIGEFGGALLLFVSLIYVGLQIRQNTKSQQAQIRQNFADLVISWNRYMIDHPELMDLVEKGGISGFEGLSQSEATKLSLHLQGAMWGFSALHRHYQEGIVDEETWSEVDDLISVYCRSEAVREAWGNSRERMGSAYRDYFDEKLKDTA
jgi:hypothetical protein